MPKILPVSVFGLPVEWSGCIKSQIKIDNVKHTPFITISDDAIVIHINDECLDITKKVISMECGKIIIDFNAAYKELLEYIESVKE